MKRRLTVTSIGARTEESRVKLFAEAAQDKWAKKSAEIEQKIIENIQSGVSLSAIYNFSRKQRGLIAEEQKDESANQFGTIRNSLRETHYLRSDKYDDQNFAGGAPDLVKNELLKVILLSQKEKLKVRVIKNQSEVDKVVAKTGLHALSKPSDLVSITEFSYDNSLIKNFSSSTGNGSILDLALKEQIPPDLITYLYVITTEDPVTHKKNSTVQISVVHDFMSYELYEFLIAEKEQLFNEIKQASCKDEDALKKIGLLAYDLSRYMFLQRGGAAVHGWIIRSLAKLKGFDLDVIRVMGLPYDIYAQVVLDREQYARDFAASIKAEQHKSVHFTSKTETGEQFPEFSTYVCSNDNSKSDKKSNSLAGNMRLSSTIKLPTPPDKESSELPYATFFSKPDMSDKYSHSNQTICLLRGDTRSPEHIKSCGGFHPVATMDAETLLQQIDRCEDQVELNRLNLILDDMLLKKVITEDEVITIQKIVALQKIIDTTNDQKLITACKDDIQELMEHLSDYQSNRAAASANKNWGKSEVEMEQLPGNFNNPLDIDFHRLTTTQNMSGFVSFTDSISVATNFSTKISRIAKDQTAGFVYLVRGRGLVHAKSIEVGEGQHGAEREYSLPGGLDWRDVIAFRKVSVNGDNKFFDGDLYINTEFEKNFPEQLQEVLKVMANANEQLSPASSNQSGFCPVL